MARIQFDARSVAPDTGPAEALPAGWYIVAVTESDIKPTSDGTGAMLVTSSQVLDGQYKGRKVTTRFNLRNTNPQAVEIAYKQLSALCHATGVLLCEDSQQLHNIPHKIKLSLKPGGPKIDKQTGQPTGEMYEPGNEVKAWKNVNEPTESAAVSMAAPATQAWAPATAQAAAPTWQAPAPAAAAPAGWGAAPPAAAPAPAPAAPATGVPWGQQPGQQPAQAPQQPAQAAPAGGAPWGAAPAAAAPAAPAGAPWGAPAAAPAAAPGSVPPWQQGPAA